MTKPKRIQRKKSAMYSIFVVSKILSYLKKQDSKTYKCTVEEHLQDNYNINIFLEPIKLPHTGIEYQLSRYNK